MISHAFLWGSALSVQKGCLCFFVCFFFPFFLYIAERIRGAPVGHQHQTLACMSLSTNGVKGKGEGFPGAFKGKCTPAGGAVEAQGGCRRTAADQFEQLQNKSMLVSNLTNLTPTTAVLD